MHLSHHTAQACLGRAGATTLVALALSLGAPGTALALDEALPEELTPQAVESGEEGTAGIETDATSPEADSAAAELTAETDVSTPAPAPESAGEDQSSDDATDEGTSLDEVTPRQEEPTAVEQATEVLPEVEQPSDEAPVAQGESSHPAVDTADTSITAPARAAAENETSDTPEQGAAPATETSTEPAPAHKAGLFRVGGKLRYYDGTSDRYVRKGHLIMNGTLYDVRGGVATKVDLSGRSYYRCADGYIFFSPSKGSKALATGSKGWVTTSSYGVRDGRYYFRTEQGYRYTTFGFSMAGRSYGVLTGKRGNARTSNYRRGGKVYLIRSSGKMLVLTKADRRRHGYDTCGFTWAKYFGDKTCSETHETKELYFLHRNTSDSAYLAGAYYAVYRKGHLRYEAAGDGLSYTNARGKKATYKGAHANTPFGFVLRAVNDHHHNITVKGDMPVVRKNRVYMADANGQLERGAAWSSRQRDAVKVAYGNLGRKRGRYGVTVDKTNHYVYLWYCNGKKWLPLLETRCTTGSDRTEVVGDKTLSYVTPKGYTKTYDHIKYFSGCTYYATGYRWTRDGGYHIHSTLYNLSNGRRTDSTLGRSASHGCIRVNINYARYVYTLVPLGTQFFVYKNQ